MEAQGLILRQMATNAIFRPPFVVCPSGHICRGMGITRRRWVTTSVRRSRQTTPPATAPRNLRPSAPNLCKCLTNRRHGSTISFIRYTRQTGSRKESSDEDGRRRQVSGCGVGSGGGSVVCAARWLSRAAKGRQSQSTLSGLSEPDPDSAAGEADLHHLRVSGVQDRNHAERRDTGGGRGLRRRRGRRHR